mmetsp:Transcript_72165/g.150765  ORF Transcript_72165/g.150765 Transcript_72165/m.150765 type:complete len:222 (-) Transcript_72165:1098-1763(-)
MVLETADLPVVVVVCDADDGHACRLDQCDQLLHPASISTRHPIDLIHDQARLAKLGGGRTFLSEESGKRLVGGEGLNLVLQISLVADIAGIQFDHIIATFGNNQPGSRRLANTWWACEQAGLLVLAIVFLPRATAVPFPVSIGILRLPPRVQPHSELLDLVSIPNEMLHLHGLMLVHPHRRSQLLDRLIRCTTLQGSGGFALVGYGFFPRIANDLGLLLHG